MNKKKELFIFRHGQTDWNVQRRAQGRKDVPLNTTGIEQARQLSQNMSGIKLDIIFSSPLKRALDTAQIVANTNSAKIEIEPLLIERSFGDIEGKLFNVTTNPAEEQTDTTQEQIVWLLAKMDDRYPNGESYDDVAKRAENALINITTKTNATKIGIATHGGIIFAMIAQILGRNNVGMIKTPNCGYIKIDYDGNKFSINQIPEWINLINNNSR